MRLSRRLRILRKSIENPESYLRDEYELIGRDLELVAVPAGSAPMRSAV